MPKSKRPIRWVDRPIPKLADKKKGKARYETREIPAFLNDIEPEFQEPITHEQSRESNLIVFLILDAIDNAKKGVDEDIHWLFDERLCEPMTLSWYCKLISVDVDRFRRTLIKRWSEIDFFDKKIVEIALGGRAGR